MKIIINFSDFSSSHFFIIYIQLRPLIFSTYIHNWHLFSILFVKFPTEGWNGRPLHERGGTKMEKMCRRTYTNDTQTIGTIFVENGLFQIFPFTDAPVPLGWEGVTHKKKCIHKGTQTIGTIFVEIGPLCVSPPIDVPAHCMGGEPLFESLHIGDILKCS